MAARVTPTVAVQLVANTAQFGTALNKASKDLKDFQNNVQKIASVFGIGLGANELFQFGKQLAIVGGETEAVTIAFNKLNASVELMGRLKDVTGGTVSELELMKTSIQAANFGISLDVLPRLLEFATLRAQQTGQAIDYLVNSIILGIGRKSPMILDNLGISLLRIREKLKGVGTESASVADFTRIIGEIAEEELTKMADFSDNAKTSIDRLSASWDNFSAKLGQSKVFESITKNLELFISGLSNDPLVRAESLIRSSSVGLGILYEKYKNFTPTYQQIDAAKKLREELIKLAFEAGGFNQTQKQLAERFNISSEAAQFLYEDLTKINDEYRKAKILQQTLARGEVDPISGMATGGEPWTGRPKIEKTEEQLKAEEKLLEKAANAWEDYFKKITRGKDIIAPATLLMEMLAGSIRSIKKEVEEPLKLPGFKKEGGLNKEDDVFGIKQWVESLRPMIAELEQIQKVLRKKNDQITEMIAEINTAFKESLQLSIQQFFYGIEQMGAKEISFGQNVLNALTEFMKMFGRKLIELGAAKLALDKLITNLAIPAPAIAIGAIAAGTALLATAGAIRKNNELAIQKTVRTSANVGNTRTFDSARIEVTGQLVGSGRDLVAVINNTNYDNKIRKGG